MSEIFYFIDKYPILEVGANTSDHYGQIKSQLKLSGKTIPENDIWIAAIAKEYNLILMSCHTYSDVSLRTPNQPAGWALHCTLVSPSGDQGVSAGIRYLNIDTTLITRGQHFIRIDVLETTAW